MISIIIPLYNKEAVIIKTLQSVRDQSCHDWECIIVDDGSKDDSAIVVKEFIKDDSRFSYYHKENGGPSSARNYGVERAKGDWVVFLDADDYFEKNAFLCFYNTITSNNRYSCFAFNFYIEIEGKRKLYSQSRSKEIANSFKEWYFKRFLPRTGAAIFRTKVLREYPHKEYIRRYEDAEMLFNIFREYKFFYVDTPVMTYCCDTLAASTPRKNISEDFLAYLSPKGMSFWEQMILFQYYQASFILYGDQAKQVYPSSPFNPLTEFLLRMMLKWINIQSRLFKILRQ